MPREFDQYRRLVENLPDGFARHRIVLDKNGAPVDYIFMEVNSPFEALTGLSRDALIDRRVSEVLPAIAESQFDWIGTYGLVAVTGEPASFEQFSEALGKWYEVTAYSDEPGHFTTVFHDITDRKRIEEALRASEVRFRSLFEQSIDGIYIGTPEGEIVDVNQAWLDLFGYERKDLVNLGVTDLYAEPSDRIDFIRRMNETGFVRDEVRYRRKNGSVFDCQRIQVAIREDSGKVVVYQGVNRDITEQKRAERALRESEEDYRSLFDESMDAICVVSMDGSTVKANRAWLELFGYTNEELEHFNILQIYVDPSERDNFKRNVARVGVIEDEVQFKKKDGTVFNCARAVVARRNLEGDIVAYQAIMRDVTPQKRHEAELERLARFDALTGILNRRSIIEKLDEWIRHVRRYKGRLSVAMIDIDFFKRVNDRHGHQVGDRVLTDVARMLQRSIRLTDFVGRYGGEEFLAILPRTGAPGAAAMGERIRASQQGMPMHDAEGTPFHVTVSIGIAELHEDDDIDVIIERADAAMYRAKSAGSNTVEVDATYHEAE